MGISTLYDAKSAKNPRFLMYFAVFNTYPQLPDVTA